MDIHSLLKGSCSLFLQVSLPDVCLEDVTSTQDNIYTVYRYVLVNKACYVTVSACTLSLIGITAWEYGTEIPEALLISAAWCHMSKFLTRAWKLLRKITVWVNITFWQCCRHCALTYVEIKCLFLCSMLISAKLLKVASMTTGYWCSKTNKYTWMFRCDLWKCIIKAWIIFGD